MLIAQLTILTKKVQVYLQIMKSYCRNKAILERILSQFQSIGLVSDINYWSNLSCQPQLMIHKLNLSHSCKYKKKIEVKRWRPNHLATMQVLSVTLLNLWSLACASLATELWIIVASLTGIKLCQPFRGHPSMTWLCKQTGSKAAVQVVGQGISKRW